MANILIFSNNPHLTAHWNHALIGEHNVSMLMNAHNDFNADMVLIDAKKLDDDENLLIVFSKHNCRFLVLGTNWPEHKQIEALVRGASGYCEDSEPKEILQRAVNSVIKCDLWIQRSLVPKIIGVLTTTRRTQGNSVKSVNIDELMAMFATLSVREIEVADMIQVGESNKRIALEMNISERTVKAHLSSIFRKLGVDDRLQLAIFLKEIEQYRKNAS